MPPVKRAHFRDAKDFIPPFYYVRLILPSSVYCEVLITTRKGRDHWSHFMEEKTEGDVSKQMLKGTQPDFGKAKILAQRFRCADSNFILKSCGHLQQGFVK